MKRNITVKQPTPHVAVVRTIEGRRREAKYAKVDLALRVDVSFDLKDLRALPGVPQDPEALACWLEDQREDLLEALNDEALKLLQEFAEEETATDIDARVRELESEDDTEMHVHGARTLCEPGDRCHELHRCAHPEKGCRHG